MRSAVVGAAATTANRSTMHRTSVSETFKNDFDVKRPSADNSAAVDSFEDNRYAWARAAQAVDRLMRFTVPTAFVLFIALMVSETV